MNPLVQTSKHSPKNSSDRDMHASRTYGNSPLGSESFPLCFLDLRHNNNPKAPQKKRKNRKILNHNHSIGKTKTYCYNVTKKQKDNNKKNTGKK